MSETKNQNLIDIINAVKIDNSYQYRDSEFLNEKITFMILNCEKVVDFGKGSREHYERFGKDQIVTVDINQYAGYPDIIDDICNLEVLKPESFSGVICRAVLEHVYAPHKAVDNIHSILKVDGYCLAYVPFLYRYHGRKDLYYQDYFRFTKDGVAFLFRDFSSVTIYPMRGRVSTMLNLFGFWKYKVEKRVKRASYWVDKICGNKNEIKQVSGYYVWGRK